MNELLIGKVKTKWPTKKSERVIQRKELRRIAINTVGAMEEVELN